MSDSKRLVFPDGFLWGTATAAYQIEGGVSADGRGQSIWDTFTHTPGKILHGDNGDVACDHYHRFEEDVELMSNLGLRAYRFSVAWSRVQPEGRGPVNEAGLDFYRRLVSSLRSRGIEPVVTLYHWDLPQALQDQGGWANRETVHRFEEYAGIVGTALADDVGIWITLNEPWFSSFVGHEFGQHAPGLRDTKAAVKAAHHLLLGHGKAVQRLRTCVRADAKVGITLNLDVIHPSTSSKGDDEAVDRVNAYINRWFLDPVLRGTYPQWLHTCFVDLLGGEFVEPGDLEEIHTKIDFLGVNYYTTIDVSAAQRDATTGSPSVTGFEVEPTGEVAPAPEPPLHPYPVYLEANVGAVPGLPKVFLGYSIHPDGLRELLVWLHKEYGDIPLYITENGAAFADYVDPNGEVRDSERVEFLRSHFIAAHEALSAGVDLRGYFVWSLLDNFEWDYGYSPRFGVVYVDYKSQERIPKLSAAFLSEVSRTNAVSGSDS